MDLNSTLYQFKDMKGSPEKTLHSADVAVLLINDFIEDTCGLALGINQSYTQETFSIVAKGCASSMKTFSHEIAHNFGAFHEAGFTLKTKNENNSYPRTIMAKEPTDTKIKTERTNYFSNPNVIHLVTKTRAGELGKPANYVHLSTNIDKVSALGDESCKCNERCISNPKAKPDKAGKKFKERKDTWKSKAKPGKEKPEKAKKNLKKRNDVLKPNPFSKKNLYKKYLADVQNLYQNYLKADQRLYKKYLNDAHKKIHEMLHLKI